ncbi:MAG: hypothetical protein U0271_34095 [Polyangiaceae bacterium]
MKVLLLGATGMIGQGVLRTCLLDPGVERVVVLGRSGAPALRAGDPAEQHLGKIHEVKHADLLEMAPVAAELRDVDACFYCLGVSAAGMSEADYKRVTYDYAVSVARALLAESPQATFVFVSGGGTDSTEKGGTMWARVKGMTENAILAMPFKASFAFRPALIRPVHGERSRTTSYRVLYAGLSPLMPLLQRALPKHVTTTERVGRAMLAVARTGSSKRVLENQDINELGAQPGE